MCAGVYWCVSFSIHEVLSVHTFARAHGAYLYICVLVYMGMGYIGTYVCWCIWVCKLLYSWSVECTHICARTWDIFVHMCAGIYECVSFSIHGVLSVLTFGRALEVYLYICLLTFTCVYVLEGVCRSKQSAMHIGRQM